jgi:glucosamine-6-phosphate deaminase
VIEPEADAAADRVAALVAQAIRSKPRCVLGLAAGRTMEPVYAKLVERHEREGLSLRDVTAFNLDEYIGAAPDDAWSFRSFALRHLVGPTDLPPASIHAPSGVAPDVFAEARRYEEAIADAGGIDLQLLGLGRNGHVGFNEPGSSLGSRTRAKALTQETLRANRDELPALGRAAPQAAITMGLGTILAARACLLLATGSAKAAAVAALVEGPVTSRLPASILQHHPEATVVLDEAAARRLQDRPYYRRAEALQRRLETGGR